MLKRPRLAAALAAVAVTVAVGVAPAGPAQGSPVSAGRLSALAPVQDFLAGRLTSLLSSQQETVLVHGSSLAAAKGAVATTGMSTVTAFDKIGVVVARGTTAQITAARAVPGVTYL